MKLLKCAIAVATVLTFASAASAGEAPVREIVVGDKAIPNIPGKRLVTLVVEYEPGVKSPSHRHARSAFVFAYVLSGRIRSQVDDEPVRIYGPGESWFESPGAHHRVSDNASETEPARLLAVFVVDAADKQMTIVDHN